MKTLLAVLLVIAGGLNISPCWAQLDVGTKPAAAQAMPPGASMADQRVPAKATPAGIGRRGPACDRVADPAKCEANRKLREENRQKASEQCKDSAGADRRKCIRDVMMAQENCATTSNPKRCEATKQAVESCNDKVGSEWRQCMRDAAPQPDCPSAPDKARCEVMRQARENCKGKPEADFRTCMRGQMPPRKPAITAP